MPNYSTHEDQLDALHRCSHLLLLSHDSPFQIGTSTTIQNAENARPCTVEIDAANGVFESGDDNYLNAFQSSYDDGEQQMHDDGYSWRKYEENPLRRGNQTSCYRCAHPNCKVKKKVERTIDGEIIHVNYKGTHAHCRKPRFTIKRNSSSESFYSYLSSKPFHTDMIDQSLLAFNGNGQLDHVTEPESSSLSI